MEKGFQSVHTQMRGDTLRGVRLDATELSVATQSNLTKANSCTIRVRVHMGHDSGISIPQRAMANEQ